MMGRPGGRLGCRTTSAIQTPGPVPLPRKPGIGRDGLGVQGLTLRQQAPCSWGPHWASAHREGRCLPAPQNKPEPRGSKRICPSLTCFFLTVSLSPSLSPVSCPSVSQGEGEWRTGQRRASHRHRGQLLQLSQDPAGPLQVPPLHQALQRHIVPHVHGGVGHLDLQHGHAWQPGDGQGTLDQGVASEPSPRVVPPPPPASVALSPSW